MANKNKVYEITQMFQNKNILQNDLEEASNVIKDMFQRKYVDKLQSVFDEHKDKIKTNLPKEVNLLNAMKPFIDKKNHETIDKLSNTIVLMNTFRSLQNDMSNNNIMVSSSQDESLHSDGVYDVDQECMLSQGNNNLSNLILIMALCNMI